MTTQSETPRTDAVFKNCPDGGDVVVLMRGHAEQLEREVTALTLDCGLLRVTVDQKKALLESADKAIADLTAQLAEARSKAEMFDYLQNAEVTHAQSFFWNYKSRKQRADAIRAAMKEPK